MPATGPSQSSDASPAGNGGAVSGASSAESAASCDAATRPAIDDGSTSPDRTDPTRAVYYHVWIIGDQSTISVGFQAQMDDLAEVAPVRSGTGTNVKPPPSGPSKKQKGSGKK